MEHSFVKLHNNSETRIPRLLPDINNFGSSITVEKIKSKISPKNQCFQTCPDFIPPSGYFDEIISESCSASLCEHFDTKIEFFPCRIIILEVLRYWLLKNVRIMRSKWLNLSYLFRMILRWSLRAF